MAGEQFGDFQLNTMLFLVRSFFLPFSAGKHQITQHWIELLAGPSPYYLNRFPWCQSAGTRHTIKAGEQLSAQLAYFISSRTEREFICWHFSPTACEIQLKYKELKIYKKGICPIATSSSLCTLSPHAFQFRLVCLGTNVHWALWFGEFVCCSHRVSSWWEVIPLEPQTFCC